MADIDEPKALAADILSEIITYIKSSRPTKTDGTSTQGFVYCQMRPGIMISPRELARPWSPVGQLPPVGQPPAPPGGTAPPAPSAGEEAKRAIQASLNTGQLCDNLLIVTDDTTYQPYSGGGRRLDVVYPQLLAAMEAAPLPPQTEATKTRIAEAKAILYDANDDDTPVYTKYKKNQLAYSAAVGNYLRTQTRLLADPATAGMAPQLLLGEQQAVDQAFDKWKASDAATVEGALAVVESEGVPMEQGMIANARKRMAQWSFPVLGVAGQMQPYTATSPNEWPELDVDDIGWTTLTRQESEFHTHFDSNGYNVASGAWRGDASSTSVDAGLSVFGFGFHGGFSTSSSSASTEFSDSANDGSHMKSDASGLSVELQYGLVRIVRPWLVTDLFRMRNWYIRGEKAGVISDGTISGQTGKDSQPPYLPMLPTHLLVIRNVKISASNWGSVKDTMSEYWGKHNTSSSSSGTSWNAGVSIPVLGPFAIAGGVSHSSSEYKGDFKDEGGRSHRDDYGSYFNGETLEIRGAQVVAAICEIIPHCPPMDDPALAAGDPK